MSRGHGSVTLTSPIGLDKDYSFNTNSDGVHVKTDDTSITTSKDDAYIVTIHFTLVLEERDLEEPLLINVNCKDVGLSTIVCLTNKNPLCNFGWTCVTTLHNSLGKDITFSVDDSIPNYIESEKIVTLQSFNMSMRSVDKIEI